MPNDRKVQYVYDAVGRQRFVLQTDSIPRWTVSESRYDAIGNLIESRRYDRYVTDAWIATVDTTNSPGINEQEMLDELSVTRLQRQPRRARWSTSSAHGSRTTPRTSCASPSMRSGPSPRTATTPWASVATTVRFAARPTPDASITRKRDRRGGRPQRREQPGAALRL